MIRYLFWLFFMGPDSTALIFPGICVVVSAASLLLALS